MRLHARRIQNLVVVLALAAFCGNCGQAVLTGTNRDASVGPTPLDSGTDSSTPVAMDGNVPVGSDSGSQPDDSGSEPRPDVQQPPIVGPWFENSRGAANVFVSGHSLVDHVAGPQEFNDGPLALLANAAGKNHRSQLQSAPGSTAQARLNDIQSGRYTTPNWTGFDTAIVMERHDIIRTLMFEDTFGSVGWFFDQMINGGGGELYFYHSWFYYNTPDQWGAPDLAPWSTWESYHRDETVLHACVAERIGAMRGTSVRIVPGGLALAALTEAIRGGQVPGISDPLTVFADQVHLNSVGNGYMGMVFYATVYRSRNTEIPNTALQSAGVTPAQFDVFADIADRVVSNYFGTYTRPTPDQCQRAMAATCTVWNQNCAGRATELFPAGAW